MTWVCRGKGRDVVLLHGWAFSAESMAPLAEALAENHRVWWRDLPGHGQAADGPMDASTIAAGAPEGAVWVGWSLGAVLAQRLCLASLPMSGLVHIAMGRRFVADEEWPGADPAALRGMRSQWPDQPARVQRQFLGLLAVGGEGARSAVRGWRERYGPPGAVGGGSGLDELAGHDQRGRRFGLPQLWIAGVQDPLVAPAAMQASADEEPDSTLISLETAGHLLPMTHGATVARHIEQWMKQPHA